MENILPCEPSPSPRRKTGPARSTPRVSKGKKGGFSISRCRSACPSPRAPPGTQHPRTRTYPHEESILYGVAPVRRHGPCHNVCDMLTTGSAETTSQNNLQAKHSLVPRPRCPSNTCLRPRLMGVLLFLRATARPDPVPPALHTRRAPRPDIGSCCTPVGRPKASRHITSICGYHRRRLLTWYPFGL